MIPTSLGRMLNPIPLELRLDMEMIFDGTYVNAGYPLELGNPLVDSPIFDRLAGERFGK